MNNISINKKRDRDENEIQEINNIDDGINGNEVISYKKFKELDYKEIKIKDLQMISNKIGIQFTGNKNELYSRIEKLLYIKDTIKEEGEREKNINSFNKEIPKLIIQDIDQGEVLFWRVFRDVYLFRFIFSNFKFQNIYKYEYIYNSSDIVSNFSNGTEILRDKVKSKKYLLFGGDQFTNISDIYKAKEFIKDNQENRVFFKQVFTNYSKEFHNKEKVLTDIIKSSNLVAFQVYKEKENIETKEMKSIIKNIFRYTSKGYILQEYRDFKMLNFLISNGYFSNTLTITYNYIDVFNESFKLKHLIKILNILLLIQNSTTNYKLNDNSQNKNLESFKSPRKRDEADHSYESNEEEDEESDDEEEESEEEESEERDTNYNSDSENEMDIDSSIENKSSENEGEEEEEELGNGEAIDSDEDNEEILKEDEIKEILESDQVKQRNLNNQNHLKELLSFKFFSFQLNSNIQDILLFQYKLNNKNKNKNNQSGQNNNNNNNQINLNTNNINNLNINNFKDKQYLNSLQKEELIDFIINNFQYKKVISNLFKFYLKLIDYQNEKPIKYYFLFKERKEVYEYSKKQGWDLSSNFEELFKITFFRNPKYQTEFVSGYQLPNIPFELIRNTFESGHIESIDVLLKRLLQINPTHLTTVHHLVLKSIKSLEFLDYLFENYRDDYFKDKNENWQIISSIQVIEYYETLMKRLGHKFMLKSFIDGNHSSTIVSLMSRAVDNPDLYLISHEEFRIESLSGIVYLFLNEKRQDVLIKLIKLFKSNTIINLSELFEYSYEPSPFSNRADIIFQWLFSSYSDDKVPLPKLAPLDDEEIITLSRVVDNQNSNLPVFQLCSKDLLLFLSWCGRYEDIFNLIGDNISVYHHVLEDIIKSNGKGFNELFIKHVCENNYHQQEYIDLLYEILDDQIRLGNLTFFKWLLLNYPQLFKRKTKKSPDSYFELPHLKSLVELSITVLRNDITDLLLNYIAFSKKTLIDLKEKRNIINKFKLNKV